ncbi:MAG: primosomal protein N', partial [Cellulosilyticum sp.]|nr:primosomal protein N' [Cellulosilyticum sp.]
MINYAGIIIAFATVSEIDRPFTYVVPDTLKMTLKVGQRVKVPFGKGNRQYIGYVVSLMEEIEPQKYRLKAISEVVEEEALLTKEQLEIVQFIVKYYGTSYAAAIDVVLPPGLKEDPISKAPSKQKVLKLNSDELKVKIYYAAHRHKQSFIKQKWIIDYLREHSKVALKDFESMEEVSKSSLKTLMQKEIVKLDEEAIIWVNDPICYEAFKVLNDEQQGAVDYLKALQEARVYRTVLLQGVTGSGKTEVFLHTIKDILESGGTALVLVPEIALTSQTLSRFKERFGNRVALTHSRMSAKERQRIYMRAKLGELSIVIGPRSAVFMPLPNLKLIVIDEAHDSSYKSEVEPKYHAIDIAKERMKYYAGQVLLATATPSLENYYEVEKGDYDLLRLDQRIGGATLPDVEIVDMRLELSNGNNTVLSKKLYKAIEETLEQDKQVMLLINRRGHSTFINCR